jgi:hypothetical protein
MLSSLVNKQYAFPREHHNLKMEQFKKNYLSFHEGVMMQFCRR